MIENPGQDLKPCKALKPLELQGDVRQRHVFPFENFPPYRAELELHCVSLIVVCVRSIQLHLRGRMSNDRSLRQAVRRDVSEHTPVALTEEHTRCCLSKSNVKAKVG